MFTQSSVSNYANEDDYNCSGSVKSRQEKLWGLQLILLERTTFKFSEGVTRFPIDIKGVHSDMIIHQANLRT
jgi:hypothetical protein